MRHTSDRPRAALGVATSFLLLATSAACSSGGEGKAGTSGDAKGASRGASAVVTTRPVTIAVQPDQRLRADIKAALDRGGTVRLLLRDVKPPSDAAHINGLRVFVNKPDADERTSPRDPHYVGSVAFQPTTSDEPQAFQLDLGDALGRLKANDALDLDQPLKFTVVATPSEPGAALPAQTRIPVGEVAVTVPKS